MRHFTMEPSGIIKGLKRNIVSEVTKFIENPLLKHRKCGTGKNQLSYCEQNILRDCGCCDCGGYLCSKQRRFMRTGRGCRKVPLC